MASVYELSNSRSSNGSSSCLCISNAYDDIYDKLPQHPLELIVNKLDGSSFGIEVARTGTIGEVKRAVESAFRYLPQHGSEKVSWDHVWSQFCLCFEGQKLLSKSDCITLFGIKDGDQLQFIRHTSNTCISPRTETEMEDTDSDDEHFIKRNKSEFEMENRVNDEAESDKDTVSCCAFKLNNLKIGRSHKGGSAERNSTSPRTPHKKSWHSRNTPRFSRSNQFQRVISKEE